MKNKTKTGTEYVAEQKMHRTKSGRVIIETTGFTKKRASIYGYAYKKLELGNTPSAYTINKE